MPRSLATRRSRFKGRAPFSGPSLVLTAFLVIAGVFFLSTLTRFQTLEESVLSKNNNGSGKDGAAAIRNPNEEAPVNPPSEIDGAEIHELQQQQAESLRRDDLMEVGDTPGARDEETDEEKEENSPQAEVGDEDEIDLSLGLPETAENEEEEERVESKDDRREVGSQQAEVEEEREVFTDAHEEEVVDVENRKAIDSTKHSLGSDVDGDGGDLEAELNEDDSSEKESGEAKVIDPATAEGEGEGEGEGFEGLDPSVIDMETGLSHEFLDQVEARGGIDDYLKESQVDFDRLDMSKENDHKIEQAFAIAHWKEWQNTTKGVKEYYKYNVMFEDSDEEKMTWKKTMIRINPSKSDGRRSRSSRRRRGSSGGAQQFLEESSSSSSRRGGGSRGQRQRGSRSTSRSADGGNRKIVPTTLPCDDNILRGLSRRERAKTGCFAKTRTKQKAART